MASDAPRSNPALHIRSALVKVDRGHAAAPELALDRVAVGQSGPKVVGDLDHREPTTSVIQISLRSSPTVK
jgi:hypothetical protein